MTLQIRLFQQLEVRNGDGSLLDMGSPTTRSLFAYLVVNHAQSIDRRRLAFQFWPRSSEQAARRNLRQYLHRIRRALEPVDPNGQFLNTEGNDVSIRLPEGCFLDVIEFQTAVTPPHTDLPYAIELYRGDLLEDIYEDWVVPERERLAQRYREALLHLIDQKEAAQQYPEAIQYARRFLAADPLLERGHVRLMQLYYAAGDRSRVKQQYEQLTAVLKKELAVEPMPETTAIFMDMTAGNYSSLSQPQPIPPDPA
ncbi:MAG: BTAD domain-containing putative transcriptional regulator, partial [Anaerolineae bacterium]